MKDSFPVFKYSNGVFPKIDISPSNTYDLVFGRILLKFLNKVDFPLPEASKSDKNSLFLTDKKRHFEISARAHYMK